MPKLFPNDTMIPNITDDLIRTKIHFSAGLRSSKIADKIVAILQQALKNSDVAREYISYVILDRTFSLHVITLNHLPNDISRDRVSETLAFASSKHDAVFFLVRSGWLRTLNTETMLHEFWHAFWQKIHSFSPADIPACYPGRPPHIGIQRSLLSAGTIEQLRRDVAQVYKNFHAMVRKLTPAMDHLTGKTNPSLAIQALNPDERAYYRQVEKLGFRITAHPAVCAPHQLDAIKSGMMFMATQDGIPVLITHLSADGKQCMGYLTCQQKDDVVCQVVGSITHFLEKCNRYERKEGVSLLKSLGHQLKRSGSRLLWGGIRAENINVEGDAGQDRLIDLISRLTRDGHIFSEADLEEIVWIYGRVKSVAVECETVLHEYPFVSALESYQHLFNGHRKQVEKSVQQCNARLPITSFNNSKENNGDLDSITLSLTSLCLLTFLFTAVQTLCFNALKRKHPSRSRAFDRSIKMILFAIVVTNSKEFSLALFMLGLSMPFFPFQGVDTISRGLCFLSVFSGNPDFSRHTANELDNAIQNMSLPQLS